MEKIKQDTGEVVDRDNISHIVDEICIRASNYNYHDSFDGIRERFRAALGISNPEDANLQQELDQIKIFDQLVKFQGSLGVNRRWGSLIERKAIEKGIELADNLRKLHHFVRGIPKDDIINVSILERIETLARLALDKATTTEEFKEVYFLSPIGSEVAEAAAKKLVDSLKK